MRATVTGSRTRRFISTLLIFVCALHCVSAHARERQPYFSLSIDKTYSPGEKIAIHFYGRDVEVLDFRLYRVNDPAAFFGKLDDVHAFNNGSNFGVEERIDEISPLEKFHNWKHDLWLDIRNFLRRQFTAEARGDIRERQVKASERTTIIGNAAFADVPVLNPGQLVARWRQTMPPRFLSETLDLPVDPLKSGVYLLEATDGRLKAYTVVIVSEVALITRVSSGHALTYLVDRRTGIPIAGATVSYWGNKARLAQATTDAQGLADLKPEKGASENTWVLAQHGSDVAVVSSFSMNQSSSPGEDWRGFLYTDRPVYRPGHTVHFKAILRRIDGEHLSAPRTGQVNVSIQGPDEKKVYQKALSLSPTGAVHDEFILPTSTALGYYSIEANMGKASASGNFYIEEYKKPEYQVKITSEKPRVLQGKSIKVTIEARYYFGEPVANAKVTYVVHKSANYFSTFSGADAGDYADEEGGRGGDEGDGGEGGEGDGVEGNDRFSAGDQLSEVEGKLDAEGRLVVSIPTHVEQDKQDMNYRIEARVTDAANREVAGHNYVLATYGSFHIDLRAQSYLYRAGDTPHFTLRAEDYEGHPLATKAHIEVIRSIYGQPREILTQRDVEIGAGGKTEFDLPMSATGSLDVIATATTPENRQVNSSAYIWIPGTGQNWFGDGDTRRIQIVPDKKTYRVGDVARVLISTGVPESHILVTTEGEGLQSRQVIAATSENVTLEFPVTKESQPNFFVSAVFIRDSQLYQATRSLKVPPVERELHIEVTPSKAQYQPGEKGSLQITATDYQGKPAAGEFSIGVVDEALYAVRPDVTGNIVNAFYPTRYQRFSVDSSLSFYFHGEAGKRSMMLAGAGGGVGRNALAQVKPGAETLIQPKIRKAFPDTALWLASVTTDASGKGVASITFPDSLTTWRTTVRGTTADTRVGSATSRVIVRKNLMIRLSVPRFFRQGDEVTVSALVHNYLTSAKHVRVSLDITGLEVLQGQTQDVDVSSRGEVKVDWRVRATAIGEARLLAKALTNEESDAIELSLPVNPFGVRQALSQSGAITDPQGANKLDISYPQSSDPASHGLDISVSPSLAGTIFGALEYLTAYPYGCTEQTMSSFLPNIVVANALKQLHLKSNVDSAGLNLKIHAGMERLYDFQHEDGGWGWWKDDESMVFMTAYVVSGLGQASAAGYEVKPEVLPKAQTWLQQQLQNHPKMIADLRAYVVLALAQNGVRDQSSLDYLWQRKESLSSHGIALAGLAMRLSNDPRAGDAAAMLEQRVKLEDMEAYWPAPFDGLMDIYTDDTPETTAYALKLLAQTRPDSPLLPKAVMWLVNHRSEAYFWVSTKQTAMVIFGLTDYLKNSHELEANFSATVTVNGKPVLAKSFNAQQALSTGGPGIHIPSSQLNPGSNAVEIRKNGPGKLYWSTRAEYFSSDKKLYQNGSMALNITRDYFRLALATTTEDKITGRQPRVVYDLRPLSGSLKPGDVLAVRLTVSGGEWKYLLVEDPIPAGAEFIERDDLYELRNKPSWWSFGFSRREFHDDRSAIFQTYFKGRTEYVYLLKVVNPGLFKVSPALVQPMYQPSVLATSDPAAVEVK